MMVGSFKGVPLVRAACIHGLGELFKELDIDTHQLIQLTGAPDDVQKREFEFLPETTLKNLILIFGESCSTEDFILTIWTKCRELYIPKILENLHLVPSMTVADAIEVFCLFIRQYSNNAQFCLERYHHHTWFARYKEGENEPWYKYAEVFSIIFMDELVAALSNSRQKTMNVSLKSTEMEPFFTCPQLLHIQFYTNRAATGIQLDDAILNKAIFMPKKQRQERAATLCEVPASFLSSFRSAIQSYISGGRLSILDAERILGIPKRTLQRRLHKEGVTYSQIVEELLLERSLQLLRNSRLSITAIASSLGYTDTANFTRFIRRRVGMTPSAYRKLNSSASDIVIT
ncbi:helix-turn-helix transcriptional regulator [Vibrio campbellii]|uniref:helix-turn-helix transcriptional regulator n=1 Tax=Vibrio campbellii TaxID=680 RepID=UPI0009B7EDFB|nr:AraC family transcriptional regulator [Vibrio campbellii]